MLREKGGNESIPYLSWTSDASDPLEDEASLRFVYGNLEHTCLMPKRVLFLAQSCHPGPDPPVILPSR